MLKIQHKILSESIYHIQNVLLHIRSNFQRTY